MLNSKPLDFVKKVLSLKEHQDILEGHSTNKAGYTIAQYTAQMIDIDTWCQSISELLPPNYSKNLVKELPDKYTWGLEHSFSLDYVAYEHGEEGPIPLGCLSDKFVLYDQRLKCLKLKTSKQLASPSELLELGSRRFWRKFATAKTSYGFEAAIIADLLIEQCIKLGKVDAKRIKGPGIWRDKKGGVINNFCGPMPNSDHYIFTRFEEFGNLEGKEICPEDVLNFLSMFNFKNPHYPIILLGWLSYAPLCGALDQRPHIYITGPKNTGKTSLLQGIEALLQPLIFTFDGSVTTEAGNQAV